MQQMQYLSYTQGKRQYLYSLLADKEKPLNSCLFSDDHSIGHVLQVYYMDMATEMFMYLRREFEAFPCI